MNLYKYRKIILFAVLTAFMVAFIWGNSCMSREESGAQSGRVTRLLQSLFDPDGNIPQESFHHFVRKTAHFTEFAALGMALCGLFYAIHQLTGRAYRSIAVLLVLLVAVVDEYIQLFADRGSAVSDVVLDFSGGLFGLGAAWLTIFLYQKRGVIWTFLRSLSKTTEN